MNRFSIQQQLDGIYCTFPAGEQRPVIGITANYGEQTSKLADGYYKQVLAAGGTPVIIPPLCDRDALLTTLGCIDGLLLSGGADINPLYCGEEPQPHLGGINAERDLPELLITRLAFNRQLPILGICRGIQTLAVALGGKVKQDINFSPPTKGGRVERIKHSQDCDRATPTHTVTISPATTLYTIYKGQGRSGGGKNGVSEKRKRI